MPGIAAAVAVLLPVAYLVLRAFSADAETLADIVFRARNVALLANTLLLVTAVLAMVTALAAPLAWLSARTDLPGRQFLTLLGAMPLAVPGYVAATAYLAAAGDQGLVHAVTGIGAPRPSGFWGAALLLSLFQFPYLFLNLRTAMLGLDAGLEESARSLGDDAWRAFWRVTAPQLRPAYLSGALLTAIHVLGDFGVVSLMRYDTFSAAIYVQYATSFDRTYAAWLALMLLALTGAMLVVDARLLRRLRLSRAGGGGARKLRPLPVGRWRVPAYAFSAAIASATLVFPALAMAYGLLGGLDASAWRRLGAALLGSVGAAVPAAVVATAAAVPLAVLGVRYRSPASRALERIAYLGYATPSIAFALSVVFFSLRLAPALYQTLALLILAYAAHFLSEAVGPIRAALYQAPPRLEEAARSLGFRPMVAFVRVTVPLLRGGLVASAAVVFLSALKDIPLTLVLSPIGYPTLAVGIWSHANEAQFIEAAAHGLVLIAVSMLFVAALLRGERRRT